MKRRGRAERRHYRLAGGFPLRLPPSEAFGLFTARGEEIWAAGWQPRFPATADGASAPDEDTVEAEDDTVPGTVFQTAAHGSVTTWVVVACEAGRRIAYARVAPTTAGTVTVEITEVQGGHSDVRVTYDLTALTPAAAGELREFADGYPAFLRSWQEAIDGWLATARG